MLSTVGATALSLLIGFPGFGLKHSHTRAASDTLPPLWKTASLLALEDQFVLGVVGPQILSAHGEAPIKVTNDQRTLDIDVDPDSGEVAAVRRVGEVALGFEVR